MTQVLLCFNKMVCLTREETFFLSFQLAKSFITLLFGGNMYDFKQD